ncbi:MAG: alanine dehydrogenase, partial [Bacteroidetes bacterium]|nr:alanine dehydrogenase [Bacteroidota bacterium]
MQIGIIKEGKIPPDNRTPLSPKQCMKLKELYPQLDIKIEHCTYRCFTDDDYRDFGIDVVESVADSDVLLGIKEVPIDKL